LYVQATNLFTITKYRGLDPEYNSGGNNMYDGMNLGIDQGAWPTPREITIGLSLGI
jgi:hypothetical protein